MSTPRQKLQTLRIITVFIGIAAMGVGIYALTKEQWIIAFAMILVAAWQVANFRQWGKKL